MSNQRQRPAGQPAHRASPRRPRPPRKVTATPASSPSAPSRRASTCRAGMSTRTLAWWGIAMAGILLLTSNLLVGTWFKNWRADLTEDGLYSISQQHAQSAVEHRRADHDAGLLHQGAGRAGAGLRRLLRARARAPGALPRHERRQAAAEFINPLAFSDAEDRAVGSGLKGIRLNSEGDMAYFGLVATNTTDNVETRRLLLARARALPRVRSDQARPHAVEAEEEGRRPDLRPAARRRAGQSDDGRPAAAAVGDPRPDPRVLRAEDRCSRTSRRSPPTSTR